MNQPLNWSQGLRKGGTPNEDVFRGDAFPDKIGYLRQRLPADASDELIVCTYDDIRPMLDGVVVVIPRVGSIGSSQRALDRWEAESAAEPAILLILALLRDLPRAQSECSEWSTRCPVR